MSGTPAATLDHDMTKQIITIEYLISSGCSAVGSARALGERDINSLNDCFIDAKSTKQGETEQNCVLGTLRLCDWTGRTKHILKIEA